VPDHSLFDGLDAYRDQRHRRAKPYSPNQGDRTRDRPAGESGIVRGIDPIWHATSFKEKKLCAKPPEMENINCE
jgi:hypothetical protein